MQFLIGDQSEPSHTVSEKRNLKNFEATSRDHYTHNMCFPTGGQFKPTVYIARFPTYGLWSLRVMTWTFWGHIHHRLHDC